MAEAADVQLDSILPPAKGAQPPLDGDQDGYDLTGGKLAVRGAGEVLMGSPVQFDRAG